MDPGVIERKSTSAAPLFKRFHSYPAVIKQLRSANFWEFIPEYGPDLLKMAS